MVPSAGGGDVLEKNNQGQFQCENHVGSSIIH